MVFPGFTAADFDAYKSERAGSHAYNRPRLEVKQKTLAFARELSERATGSGTALEVCASDEHPSIWNHKSVTAQWVFFWRDAAARKQLETVLDVGRSVGASLGDPTPYFRHAFLAVFIDADKVEMTFKIHNDASVDARNLRARVENPVACELLLQTLRALPADFTVGSTAGESVPVSSLDAGSLGDSVRSLFAEPAQSEGWWFVTRSVDRATAIDRGASIADDLSSAFDALLPLYKLVAWSHDNDLLSLDRELEAAREVRAAHVTEDTAREAAWRAQHDADIVRRREEATVETRERMASLVPARPSAVHAAVQTVVREVEAPPKPVVTVPKPAIAAPKPVIATPKPTREARPSSTPRADRPSAGPPPRMAAPVLVESEAPVALGAQVRVRTGPFAGRVGTVTAVDGKGYVKVAFGPMSARLVTQELVTLAEV